MKNAVFALFLLLPLAGCHLNRHPYAHRKPSSHADFYVSTGGNDKWSGHLSQPRKNGHDGPFATLTRAQQAVRERIARVPGKNVKVLVRAGRYELAEPLVFTPLDSAGGRSSVSYAAFPEEKVSISGGRKVTGWKKAEGNVWTLKLDEGHKPIYWMTELFMNDKRLTRARFPNAGDMMIVTWMPGDKEENHHQLFEMDRDFPGGNLLGKDTELVMYQVWTSARARVKESEGRRIKTQTTMGFIGHSWTSAAVGRKVYLENAREFIDQPGEWYFDRDTSILYYQAAEGEDPNREEFVVPVLDHLVTFEGSKGNPVNRVNLFNLNFEHTFWDLPLIGFSGVQAGHYGWRYNEPEPTFALPNAIQYSYARNCLLWECRVAHTGAGGVAFGAGSRQNEIVACEFYDVGGNAVAVGWRPRSDDPPGRFFDNDWDDLSDAPAGNEVISNRIHECGVVQKGCVGVWIAFSPGTRLTNNLIYDLPYTAVSVGFRWGDTPSSQRECLIAGNHIHDVMKELYDGGAIYTLGAQPGTVVRHNLIHDVYRGHGLYTDEGSSRILLENNVVYRVGGWAYQHHYGHHNIVRNNIFAAAGMDYIVRTRNEEEPSFNFENNIVLVDDGALLNKTDWYTPQIAEEFKRHWSVPQGKLLFGNWSNNKFNMDKNLYWNMAGGPLEFDGGSFEQWQARGHDRNSRIADPMFVNPEAGNFSLKPGSPALELGFKPIDLSQVGPVRKR